MAAEPQQRPITYISWAQFCSRSDSTAVRLGGVSHMVYSPEFGSRYLTIIFKYLSQSWKTLRILWKERPAAVFVMTPPVVACFSVFLYALLTRSRYVIDAHTGAFVDPRWTPFLFLHAFFSRHAATTIVTNDHLAGIVRGWGAKATIVTDVPVIFAEPADPGLAPGENMVLVSTFTPDEPIENFLRAAAEIPDVTFHVTGNSKKASPELHALRPSNVRFTGFLPDGEYVGLLQGCDAVIALTSENFTMQRGAYEAIYLGQPVVVTGFDVLRKSFHMGALYTDNSVEDLVEAIQRMRVDRERLQADAEILREKKIAQWQERERELVEIAMS